MSDARPSLRRRRPGTSRWALAALLCSSVLFCPPLPALGLLLGVRALFDIRAVPGRRGRGLALAAIILGGTVTVLWAAGAIWWDRNARTLMQEGPAPLIASGQTGDVATMRGGFVDGPGNTDAAARGFLETLTARHGRLLAAVPDDESAATLKNRPVLSAGRVTIPYLFRFERGAAPGEAELVVYEGGWWNLVLRFARVSVGEEGERVEFPAAP